MAEPIVTPLGSGTLEGLTLPTISSGDGSNITSVVVSSTFNLTTDILQAYLYDTQGNFITRLTTGYTVDNLPIGEETPNLSISPGEDLKTNGYNRGQYQVNYNFTSPLIPNNPNFYITEVSLDRTELRINSATLSTPQLRGVYETLLQDLNNTATFEGFYLDFGSNQLEFAINVGFDNNTLLIKLYEPLNNTFGNSSNFNFLAKKADSQSYQVVFPEEEIVLDTKKYLRGPNLNLKVNTQVGNTTEFKTINTLTSASTQNITNQLQSVLVENRAELNTDYEDYNNFVFFSSAGTRLENFNYKVTQLETYTAQLARLDGLSNTPTSELSSSKAFYKGEIKKITENFDGYDYYLYYESSSYTWPKQNSTKPYTLYSYTSSEATNWLSTQGEIALTYDRENRNNLYEIFPTYIKDDRDNTQFKLFSELTAQMFDEIWVYTKALENRQDGDNSLSGGISIDLVADALRSYGLDIYESSFANTDLFTSLLGVTDVGGTLPPTGSELITTYVTASAETIPSNDAQKLIYKRLYHNLPYLLKKKGTVSGLKVLLNCYGIPDTILRVSEFGGKDKNINTWDNWYNQFNYTYNNTGSGYLTTAWEGIGFLSTWVAASPISLPLVPDGTYNMLVDWGDGSTDRITAWDDTAKTHNYSSSGTYYVTITGTIKGFAFNNTGYTSSLTDIRNWGPLELSTSASFYGANELGPIVGPTSNWYKLTATDFPKISTTSMKDFFRDTRQFSGSIENWNTSTVTSLENTFNNAPLFNTPLSWDTSLVTSMSGTFARATDFNQPLNWNTGNVTNFAHMFYSASSYNHPIAVLPTATTIESMFEDATSFNADVVSIDTTNITTMKNTFKGATDFGIGGTPSIVDWGTSNVITMEGMFQDAINFNEDIATNGNQWSTTEVVKMNSMFQGATSFSGTGSNGGVSTWNTQNVDNMSFMFYSASAFNADISSWNISNLLDATEMLSGATSFTTLNYDALLNGWAAQIPFVQANVTLDARNTNYTIGVSQAARDALTGAPFNWTINDGGGI